nr:unnamed protein product [Spirometra erinaceieuropaei]
MHFSISQTKKLKSGSEKSFTVYEIFLNGVFHSLARYRQFLSLYKALQPSGSLSNFNFPPKMLSTSTEALFLRKLGLQKFLHIIESEPQLLMAPATVQFFAHAREAYVRDLPSCDCEVSIRFLDRRQVTLSVRNTDAVDVVLRKVCSQVNIPIDLTYAFGLFLVRSSPEDDEEEEVLIRRQLYRFECPVISLEEANKSGAPHFLLLRKCCLSLSVDEQLLANETTARLLYAQALSDLRLGSKNPLPPLTPNFTNFPPEHLSSTCWPASVTFPESLPLEDIRATLHWCHTSVPLYGCMPIHFCLTDLADPEFESRLNSNATSPPTQPALRPADVYIGRDALRVVLTGPFLTASVSTEKAAENSYASEDQQHSATTAADADAAVLGEGTIKQTDGSAMGSSDAFLLLTLPLTKIRSWQLITPEVDSDAVLSRLVIQYAGRNLLSRAPHSAASTPTTVAKSQPLDPLAIRDDVQPSSNDDSTGNYLPRFFISKLHRITITSDKQDQVFLLNDLLLQLIDELTRAERQETVFDSPSARLPPNYLFSLRPDGCDIHFSSVSSLSEPDATTQRVREALVSGARTLSSNLKRLFHGSGGGGGGSSNGSSAPASPDASASRGSRPLLAQSADEARRMLTSDATSLAPTPLGPQLLLPPTASPVSGGRLELRLDSGAHRPPPEVDPLG